MDALVAHNKKAKDNCINYLHQHNLPSMPFMTKVKPVSDKQDGVSSIVEIDVGNAVFLVDKDLRSTQERPSVASAKSDSRSNKYDNEIEALYEAKQLAEAEMSKVRDIKLKKQQSSVQSMLLEEKIKYATQEKEDKEN